MNFEPTIERWKIVALKPIINPILAMFDPMIFPSAISSFPPIAAKREMVETKMGAFVERKYYIARLEKNVS